MHREIQIKQLNIIDGLRHETSGLCEKTNSIYIVFYHVQVIWVHTHIRCVTCVCARSGSHCIHTGHAVWMQMISFSLL